MNQIYVIPVDTEEIYIFEIHEEMEPEEIEFFLKKLGFNTKNITWGGFGGKIYIHGSVKIENNVQRII